MMERNFFTFVKSQVFACNPSPLFSAFHSFPEWPETNITKIRFLDYMTREFSLSKFYARLRRVVEALKLRLIDIIYYYYIIYDIYASTGVGFEPTTFGLTLKRSTNWAISGGFVSSSVLVSIEFIFSVNWTMAVNKTTHKTHKIT